MYQRLLWGIATWSLLVILLSGGSLIFVWQNPTYGGFLWGYESITRQYKPDDTYIHPEVASLLSPNTFILAVNGFDAHPQRIAVHLNEDIWSGCPTPPPAEKRVTYTILEGGEERTLANMPLFCFNVTDLLFQILAVVPSALFFWLAGIVILRNTPQQQDMYERAFGLNSAFVFLGMAAFVGKQVYFEPGIDTPYGWGMIMGASLPTAVLLPAAVWFNVLLIPPASAHKRHHERRPWGVALVLFWVITILSINFVLFHPLHLLPALWHQRLSLIHPITWMLINVGMFSMGLRGLYIARRYPSPFYKRQGLAIAGATGAVGILIIAAIVQTIAQPNILNFFPPQDLLLVVTTAVTLGISFALLNNRVLPQSSWLAQILPLFGIVAISCATLAFVFKLPSVGWQFAGAVALIALLTFILRGDHRYKKLLDRLSNYRNIPAEEVEAFLRQTSQPQSLSLLAQTVVTQLVYLLNLRGASLWLVDYTADAFVLFSTHHHFPPVERLPLAVRQTLDDTAVLTAENQQLKPKILPLDNGEECVGLLILLPSTSQLHFNNPADQQALEALSAHTALVINRAQAIAEARQMAVSEQDIRLRERTELGRTLHDVAVQDLNAILMSLWFLKEDLSQLPQVEENLGEAIKTLRDLSNDLTADDEQTGLALADKLHKLVAMRQEQYPQVQFTTHFDQLPPLSAQQAHDFWLACRQAVDNALKHAEPTAIRVELIYDCPVEAHQAQLSFVVTDNGRGFVYHNTAELLKKGHNGLYNMESRLLRHKGSLIIHSHPEQGTKMIGQMPVPRA